MFQKKSLLGASVALSTLALVGCNLAGGLPTTTNPSPTPSPAASSAPASFVGFPTGSALTGRFTFDEGNPGEGLQVIARNSSKQRLANAVTSDKAGYFAFKPGTSTNDVQVDSSYQLIFDDQNPTTVTDPKFNVAGLFVTQPVKAISNPSTLVPMVTADIAWSPNPVPTVDGSTSGKFTFTKNSKWTNVSYQVAIFQKTVSNTYSALATLDVPSSDSSVTWDKMTTGKSPNTVVSPGNYYFQIKFCTSSKSFGDTDALFGSTKYIPFTLN